MTNLSPETVEKLRARIAEQKLERIADLILENTVECYSMVAVGKDDYASTGKTRFGGDPDLPKGFAWPVADPPDGATARLSNFIAQINFAELPSLSQSTGLPKSGILYLFVREMESAADPVLLDAIYNADENANLARVPNPPDEQLRDEYLLHLVPQRIKAVPAISLAFFRKQFRKTVEQMFGIDGLLSLYELESSFQQVGHIGQMLGFANAGDDRANLYRQVQLTALDHRRLMFNDYWDSMDEYERYIEQWRRKGDDGLVKNYEGMRQGVEWLVEHRDKIADGVAQLRLLFRLDSNSEMDLNMMDADPLYVFIRQPDLARKDFSHLAGEVTQG